MVKEVVSVKLPVNESLVIQKNVLEPDNKTGNEKRVCIVTGTHGDELEGQYVCYEVNRIIQSQKHKLKGIVEIYPALNPMGIDSITRGIPLFDLDMNRTFPGSSDGAMTEYVAAKIIDDIKGSDLCIDIHSSNIYLTEIPQIRISEETAETLIPYGKELNIDFIWVHEAATVLHSTLAHSLNSIGVPTLVVEMGVGMRVTQRYGQELVDGIFNLLTKMGVWESEEYIKVKKPIISTGYKVEFINAAASGMFIPCTKHWQTVKKNETIGQIVDPLKGEVLSEVKSPCDGSVFTLREYPVVYNGSLIARILGGLE